MSFLDTNIIIRFLTSDDLNLGNRRVGLRFILDVPAGATIVSADVQFTAQEESTKASTLTVEGEANATALPFTTSQFDVTNRPRTSAAVTWLPPVWTTQGAAAAAERTPDLTAIIQEIIDQPGWQQGNGLVLIITGRGEREAWAYDGSPAMAPVLYVEYTQGP